MTTLRKALAAGLLLGVASTASLAQPTDEAPADEASAAPPSYALVVSAGYNGFTLGEMAAFHEAVVGSYVQAGVRVPTQRLFPGSAVFGVDLLRRRPGPMGGDGRLRWTAEFGLGARYTSTRAYSLYGDYAGTLDVVSSVGAFTLESVSRVLFGPDGRPQPFLGSRGGMLVARTSTKDAIDLGEFGRASSEARGWGAGFTIEGFAGYRVPVRGVDLTVQAGYRYGRVGRVRGEVLLDGAEVESGELPYRLGLSGVVGMVGVTLGL